MMWPIWTGQVTPHKIHIFHEEKFKAYFLMIDSLSLFGLFNHPQHRLFIFSCWKKGQILKRKVREDEKKTLVEKILIDTLVSSCFIQCCHHIGMQIYFSESSKNKIAIPLVKKNLIDGKHILNFIEN